MTDRSAPEADSRLSAILLTLGAAFIFALSDTGAKLAVSSLPVIEVYWLRSLVVVLVSLPPIILRSGWQALRTTQPGLQLLRGVCVFASSIAFLTGLIHLPLADATAINFVWPLLVTGFSVLILKEQVGVRRALATAVGFAGMILIVRPGSGAFHWAAVFPLAAAVLWALSSVLTRLMSANERAETTILWSSLLAFAASSLAMPFVFVWPTARELGICALIGIGSATAHAMIVLAFTRAPASALAPFSYTQLVWAAICGYILFRTFPDANVAAGSLLIAASGIYTAHRERVRRSSMPAR